MEKRLFIHIPKNGGLTVRYSKVLQPLILTATRDKHKSKEYSDAVLKQMNKNKDHHGFEHARWRDIHPDFQKLKAFAIVRNPWSRTASRYFFAKQEIDLKRQPKDYADVSSFESFLEERHKWGNQPYMWHRAVRGWYPQKDHVVDEEGKCRCDVMRTEYLNQDLCKYFNLEEMTRKRNVTISVIKRPYQEIYTDSTIQIVADWYKEDIDFFGFDFETSAQRNIWNDKS